MNNRILFVIVYVFLLSYSYPAFGESFLNGAKKENYQDSIKILYPSIDNQVPIISRSLFQILSYYPELGRIQIKITYKSIRTTMASRPKVLSLFTKKGGREYNIFLKGKRDRRNTPLFLDLEENMLKGVLAHELAHIVDYESKNNFGILLMGIHYLLPSGKRKTEHRIDKIVINRQLGENLLEYSDYVLNKSNASGKYKRFKAKIYYNPSEIRELINIANKSSPIYLSGTSKDN